MRGFEPKVTGWASITEWEEGHLLLYSTDTDGHFVQAMLRDEAGDDTRALRSLYSLAVIRFVNGFCDAEQKGTTARSVHGLALELGISEYLVDLRHDATHTALPALPVLRHAARDALAWLRSNYWRRQSDHLSDTLNGIAALLSQYQASVATQKQGSSSPRTDTGDVLRDIVRIVSPNSIGRFLIPQLLGSGAMVPTHKKGHIVAPDKAGSKAMFGLWDRALRHFTQAWPHFIPMLLAEAVAIVCSGTTADSAASTTGGAAYARRNGATFDRNRGLWLASWIERVLDKFATDRAVRLALLRQCIVSQTSAAKKVVAILLDGVGDLATPGLTAVVRRLSTASGGQPVIKPLNKPTKEAAVAAAEGASTAALEGSVEPTAAEFRARVDLLCTEVGGVMKETPCSSTAKQVSPWTLSKDRRWIGCPVGVLVGGERSEVAGLRQVSPLTEEQKQRLRTDRACGLGGNGDSTNIDGRSASPGVGLARNRNPPLRGAQCANGDLGDDRSDDLEGDTGSALSNSTSDLRLGTDQEAGEGTSSDDEGNSGTSAKRQRLDVLPADSYSSVTASAASLVTIF